MNDWILISICAFAAAVVFAGVMIPQILLISFRKRLFDEPDERKIHQGVVPRLGGIAFMPVVFLVMALLIGIGVTYESQSVLSLVWLSARAAAFTFCALLILWIVGLADDLVGVRYRAKFAVQILCGILLIAGGVWFENFHGILGIHQIPEWIGWPLTLLLTVFIINSINLIDGIDGLASGLSGIALLLYGIVLLMEGVYAPAILAFTTLGVLMPFFYFNVFGNAAKHKKIFMGDTGTLTIGMVLAFCVMRLLQCGPEEELIGANMAVVAFSPLIVPCFDVIRVYFYRIKHNKNPFLPDKNHIHHRLLARGWSQRKAMMAIVGFSLVLSVINIWLSRYLNVNIVIGFDILVWLLCIYTVAVRRRSSR